MREAHNTRVPRPTLFSLARTPVSRKELALESSETLRDKYEIKWGKDKSADRAGECRCDEIILMNGIVI